MFLGFFDSNLYSYEKLFGLSITGGLNPNPGSVQFFGGYPDAKVKSYTTYWLSVHFIAGPD